MGIDPLLAILMNNFARYPQMQARDLYKLLLQAARGNEHAAENEHEVRRWLGREMAEMGAGPADPLLDPISPDGRILRVHLRPYVVSGRDPEKLLKAFIRTANEVHGTNDTLSEYVGSAAKAAEQGLLPVAAAQITEFFKDMEAKDFPAAHHSEVYGRLYRPAYRVVARDFLEVI